MKNLYKILNIEQSAVPEEIKKAYFEMAKKYHPDSGDESEIKKFYEVNEAYQILSNKEERRAYDLTISEGKIVGGLVEEIVHRPIPEEQAPEEEIDLFRQRETHRFRRTIFWQAVLRVIGLSFLFAGVGYIFTLLLNGMWYFGTFAGFVIGFIWSVYKNFNVNSFIKSHTTKLITLFLRWVLLFVAISYFVFLVIGELE
jgi:curved DNA-binding protein CbpA